MADISAYGGFDCLLSVGGAAAAGAWGGAKAGARAAPFLAFTGLGAPAIVGGCTLIGAIGGGLLAYSRCDV